MINTGFVLKVTKPTDFLKIRWIAFPLLNRMGRIYDVRGHPEVFFEHCLILLKQTTLF